ncbi:hypothetical protein ABMA27_006886 [Loxostege sticticalis]|uniref:FAM194 C-terminal domain-containing protein n=1 Tax=Loxostege sticticalis TaxID=481309 RepID=A0ABR3IKT8_LOXSC
MGSQGREHVFRCPCYENHKDYQKIVDLKDAGLVIYRQTTRIEDVNPKTNATQSATSTADDIFILHNTNDVEIISADIMSTFDQNKVSCPRCRHIIENAKKLLKSIPKIKRNDIIGICEHCRRKIPRIPCQKCNEIVEKYVAGRDDSKDGKHYVAGRDDFKDGKHYVAGREDSKDGKHYVTTWLSKIHRLLKDVVRGEKHQIKKGRTFSDLNIQNLHHNSPLSLREPEIGDLFYSGTLRTGSTKSLNLSDRSYHSHPNYPKVKKHTTFAEFTEQEDFIPTKNKQFISRSYHDLPYNITDHDLPYNITDDSLSLIDSVSEDFRGRKSITDLTLKKLSMIPIGKYKSEEVSGIRSSKLSMIPIGKYKSEEVSGIRSSTDLSSRKPPGFSPGKYKSENALPSSTSGFEAEDNIKEGFGYHFLNGDDGKKKPPKKYISSSQLIADTQNMLKARAEEEKKRLDEKRRLEEEKQERRRKEREARQLEKERREEEKRLAEEEAKRLAAEEKKRLDEEEKKTRLAEENEKKSEETKKPAKEEQKKLQKETKSPKEKPDSVQKKQVSKTASKLKETTQEQRTPIETPKKKDEKPKIKEAPPEKPKPQEENPKTKEPLPEKPEPQTKIEEKSPKIGTKTTKIEEKPPPKFEAPPPAQAKFEVKLPKADLPKFVEKPLKIFVEEVEKPKKEKPKPVVKEKVQDQPKETEKKDKKETELKKSDDKEVVKEQVKEQAKPKKADEDGHDETFRKLLAEQAKNKEEMQKLKRQQQEEERKAREAAEKKVNEKKAQLESVPVIKPKKTQALELEQKPEKSPEKPNMKELNMKEVKVRKPSPDDLILQLVKLKKSTKGESNKLIKKGLDVAHILTRHKGHNNKNKDCIACKNSDIELDLESLNKPDDGDKMADIIIGQKIFKYKPPLTEKRKEEPALPVLFKTSYDEEATVIKKGEDDITKVVPGEIEPTAQKIPVSTAKGGKGVEQEPAKGIIRYALSDRTFIDKGWTMLPTEKVVRKMNVYRMRPAQPEFDWFEHNKNKRLMQYDTGEKLAEFDDNGRGRWYYKNGRLALDYYDAEETNAQQRYVVYSSGEPDERGRSRPLTILATFDYLGNGVVFDHSGKIRLKYNQTEGVVLDRAIGPVSHWKWHTLNDPPVLQQVMIDTNMSYKDPDIVKLGGPGDNKMRPDNEEMLAIEFDNFIKEKSKKLTQKFKPFQIKMKALKINEAFSLKVLDQATVYLIFRDGSANLKLNIGMILDHKEIVDTDTAEVGEVSNTLERLPARTDSIAGMQASVAHAQRIERQRVERERRLRPAEPCGSADRLIAAASRPLRPPFRTAPSCTTATSSDYPCKCRKPSSSNVYYDTRLI